MLILVFVVSYGVKKGTLQTYSTFWNVSPYDNLRVVKQKLQKILITRFQFSIITSRPTIYILFLFWCFFFFFGEFLLLITFNYNSVSDLIPSSYFLLIKTHIIFFTSTASQYLGETVFVYILFFTTAALKFLLNLRYTFDYHYLKYSAHWDLIFLFLIFYLIVANSTITLIFVAAGMLYLSFRIFYKKSNRLSS
jgi:hypothetical protein